MPIPMNSYTAKLSLGVVGIYAGYQQVDYWYFGQHEKTRFASIEDQVEAKEMCRVSLSPRSNWQSKCEASHQLIDLCGRGHVHE